MEHWYLRAIRLSETDIHEKSCAAREHCFDRPEKDLETMEVFIVGEETV